MELFTIRELKNLPKYDLCKFLRKVDNKFFDIADSQFMNLVNNLEMKTYRVIREHQRPDLLSEHIYGTGNTSLWWLLLFINGLSSPQELVSGMLIKFPTLNQLEDVYLQLSSTKVSIKNSVDSTINKAIISKELL